MEHILHHHRVSGSAGLDFEELHYFLADLQARCLCFLRIPTILLRLACLVLLPVASRTLCNLSLRAWILVSHQQTRSVCDMPRLAYLLVMGCTLWILLSENFCSLLFHSYDSRVTRVNSTNVLDEGLRSGEEQRLETPGSRLAHKVPRFTSPRWRIATSC
jgi:hypothetical protein